MRGHNSKLVNAWLYLRHLRAVAADRTAEASKHGMLRSSAAERSDIRNSLAVAEKGMKHQAHLDRGPANTRKLR
jgi:hypothetical protein